VDGGIELKSGSNRVIRGGNFNNNAVNCRSAQRNNNTPGNTNNNIGFRLVNPWMDQSSRLQGDAARAEGHGQARFLSRRDARRITMSGCGW